MNLGWCNCELRLWFLQLSLLVHDRHFRSYDWFNRHSCYSWKWEDSAYLLVFVCFLDRYTIELDCRDFDIVEIFLATTKLFIESSNVYIETKRNVDPFSTNFLIFPSYDHAGMHQKSYKDPRFFSFQCTRCLIQ